VLGKPQEKTAINSTLVVVRSELFGGAHPCRLGTTFPAPSPRAAVAPLLFQPTTHRRLLRDTSLCITFRQWYQVAPARIFKVPSSAYRTLKVNRPGNVSPGRSSSPVAPPLPPRPCRIQQSSIIWSFPVACCAFAFTIPPKHGNKPLIFVGPQLSYRRHV
jgi:hypothetical protein